MIITCPNCNKQFKIDNSLIPDDGRDLQCGSCNHVWFYKTEDESQAPLTLTENVSENKIIAHVNYTLLYLIATIPMFIVFSYCLNRLKSIFCL